MTTSSISPDIKRVAAHFGVSAALIAAVNQAEGDLLKAVRCSIKIDTYEQALQVTCRSAAHAMSDFLQAGGGSQAEFVQFWASRWAPVGAGNDPTQLNSNWPKNVLALWRKFAV